MRPFEWLFLLSFFPILLLPAVPAKIHWRWMVGSMVLLGMMGLLHLILEGWRIQMVALYGLAVLMLIGRGGMLLRPERPIRRIRGFVISGIIGLCAGAGGIGAGWLLPVVMLPSPTGPYHVGIVDRELIDTARNRRLMVSIWYPTDQSSTSAPLTHHPDEVASALGTLSGLPGIGLQHLRYMTVSASEGVPLLTENSPFPVLIFSHGMVGLRLQSSSILQELASWGYVVVGLDHTDAAAVTVFPDGETRVYDLARFGITSTVEPTQALMTEHVLPVWVADQQFVYDTLETWATNDPLLVGRLDLMRVGSFGHSFGGATALEVCRIDARCAAAANLDGALYGGIITAPAVRPLLLMTSEESNQYSEAMEAWTRMMSQASEAAYWLEIPQSSHFSFTITQLLSPLLVPHDYDPREGLHIMDRELHAFFDHFVRGDTSQPFGPDVGETDVNWIRKK